MLVVSDDGVIIRMEAAGISELGRATQGVRIMRLSEGARVISVALTDRAESEDAPAGGDRDMKQVTIYTDGACSGNPGPGGWGAILRYGAHEKELSGGEPSTTNNRMELLGAITALQSLREPCQVSLYTDSQYLANAVNLGWLRGWKQKGWRRKDGELKNVDLWQTLDGLLQTHKVQFFLGQGPR